MSSFAEIFEENEPIVVLVSLFADFDETECVLWFILN